jgi:hypothetical protein
MKKINIGRSGIFDGLFGNPVKEKRVSKQYRSYLRMVIEECPVEVAWLKAVLDMGNAVLYCPGCEVNSPTCHARIIKQELGVTLFQKNILTDSQNPVNVSSPAREGQITKRHQEHMNSTKLALIAGILATAFTQIKNVFSGDDEPAAPETPKKGPGRPAKQSKPEPPADPDDDIGGEDDTETTVNLEDENVVDVDELVVKIKGMATQLFQKDPANKVKVKKLLAQVGKEKLGDIDTEEDAAVLITGMKKLGAK